jgi:hypothetical protein
MESETVPDRVSAKAAAVNNEPRETTNANFLMRASLLSEVIIFGRRSPKKDLTVCGEVFCI